MEGFAGLTGGIQQILLPVPVKIPGMEGTFSARIKDGTIVEIDQCVANPFTYGVPIRQPRCRSKASNLNQKKECSMSGPLCLLPGTIVLWRSKPRLESRNPVALSSIRSPLYGYIGVAGDSTEVVNYIRRSLANIVVRETANMVLRETSVERAPHASTAPAWSSSPDLN